MNEKDFTIIGTYRAIDLHFDNVRDDEHACFVMEVLAEFPANQVVSAIDIDGARPNELFHGFGMNSLRSSVQFALQMKAEEAKLNFLSNSMMDMG